MSVSTGLLSRHLFALCSLKTRSHGTGSKDEIEEEAFGGQLVDLVHNPPGDSESNLVSHIHFTLSTTMQKYFKFVSEHIHID